MHKAIILIVALFYTSNLYAQNSNGLSVLDVFDQYAISKAAAVACLKPDGRLDSGYDSNFAVVYNTAWRRLRELKNSDISNQQITSTLDNRVQTLHANVTKDAVKEGCESKSYKELINLYKYHAIWNPYAGTN